MNECTQVWSAADDLQPLFAEVDRRVAVNIRRVQKAFMDHRIGPHHFQGSTGYGHGDFGREALDSVSQGFGAGHAVERTSSCAWSGSVWMGHAGPAGMPRCSVGVQLEPGGAGRKEGRGGTCTSGIRAPTRAPQAMATGALAGRRSTA